MYSMHKMFSLIQDSRCKIPLDRLTLSHKIYAADDVDFFLAKVIEISLKFNLNQFSSVLLHRRLQWSTFRTRFGGVYAYFRIGSGVNHTKQPSPKALTQILPQPRELHFRPEGQSLSLEQMYLVNWHLIKPSNGGQWPEITNSKYL